MGTEAGAGVVAWSRGAWVHHAHGGAVRSFRLAGASDGSSRADALRDIEHVKHRVLFLRQTSCGTVASAGRCLCCFAGLVRFKAAVFFNQNVIDIYYLVYVVYYSFSRGMWAICNILVAAALTAAQTALALFQSCLASRFSRSKKKERPSRGKK